MAGWSIVQTSYWQQVLSAGGDVPDDRPLHDLTEDLTRMLGSVSPEERDGTAYPVLATWIGRGVYDDLLEGLGDGMAAGLTAGLGENGTDTVFRRSYSVLVLAECIARDNVLNHLSASKLLEWADSIATWFLRESDLRGFVPGKGWAHALAHGGDAIGVLGQSFAFSEPELTVLLDVLADRMLLPSSVWTAGEADRLASATMEILRRDAISINVLEPWVARIASGAAVQAAYDDSDPYQRSANPEAYLRALHLQLALAPTPPAVRPDLLLVVIEALRVTNPQFLALATGQ